MSAGAPTGETFRTASVQASSVWLDKAATTEKVCALIAEAGRGGAQIVALPESFVPGFPYWLFTMKLHDAVGYHRKLHDEAVEVPGPETRAFEKAAIEAGVTAVVGITERDPGHVGTLFNTNLVFGPEGYLGKHRKLVPTWAERVVWTGGDGSTLDVFDTPQGPLGTLCCGENVNTLARYALLGEGERVHVANFPSCAPLAGLHEDTNDVYLPAAAHAYEGRLYNVVAQEFGTPEVCEAVGSEYVPEAWNCISGTIGPDGNWIESLRDEEGIVYADCDPGATIEGRIFHDIVGHYNRFDVLQLHVDRTSRGPLVSSQASPAERS
ncbi:MAG TPA: carbon-nitrogen hydrolase family protein [Solirubrobacterales bacterium]|nr:carbon-nitrogen hydrolase family protein [Solirubrobacterales bacterium]